MQIFILTLGTRGDFELFLMLGCELRRREHRVLLGTSAFYAAAARESGIDWVQIGDGGRDELVSIVRSLASVRDRTRRTHLYYTRWLRPQLATSRNRITSIGVTTDYFISNLKMVLQRDGEILPGAAVTYDPPIALEELAKYGTQSRAGRILDLVAMNKDLVDPEDRWGEQYRFTGFWTDERRHQWTPPPELAEFLAHGPPPVVVTMGSMVMFDAEKLVGDIVEALRRSAQRGIIVGGWSGISSEDPSAGVRCVSEAPYDWLFPKASCVIHHGGCGTVAAVLRAGKPSILLPQITAQERFATMLAREHLATGVFDAHSLNPDELAAAIHTAVTDERVDRSAREWQKVVGAERGLEAAANLIEAHWNQMGRERAG